MLALKVILAESDRMPTLIFDELDIGIGGRIAESVGHRLKLLSRDHQVLCITHLHQVACWGRTHFTVHKQSARGRSVTLVDHLDEDGRVREIARMLAGRRWTTWPFPTPARCSGARRPYEPCDPCEGRRHESGFLRER